MAKTPKQMILIDGKNVCPKCLERNFKSLRTKDSHMSIVKDCDVSPDSKQHLGLFQFVYVCSTCGFDIVEYCDIKKGM